MNHIRLSENTLDVIARSDLSDEAISNSLIYKEARLLRFARDDGNWSFSTGSYGSYRRVHGKRLQPQLKL